MQKHLDFLNLLSKTHPIQQRPILFNRDPSYSTETHPIQQRALLETAEPDQVHAICECICNIMHGNTTSLFLRCKKWADTQKASVTLSCRYKSTLQEKEQFTIAKWWFNFGAPFPPVISAILDLSTIQRNNGHI